MKKSTISALITILFLSGIATAQLQKIRIPKVKKTDPIINNINRINNLKTRSNQTTNNSSNKSAQNSNANSSPLNKSRRQMVIDDGATFFSARPYKRRDAANRQYVYAGWYLVKDLRLMGTFPENSGFRVIVKKNGKELSNEFCPGEKLSKWKPENTNDNFMKCDDSNRDNAYNRLESPKNLKPITEIGLLDVEVYYLDGDTDEETLVRKYKIDVHRTQNLRGAKGKEFNGVFDHYIQRHAEVSYGILSFNDAGVSIPSQFNQAKLYRGQLRIRMGINSDQRDVNGQYVRCSVNGERIKLVQDKFSVRFRGFDYAQSSEKETARASREATKYNEKIHFDYYAGLLPLYTNKNVPANDAVKTGIDEHPGKWECKIMKNGAIYRIFHFEVAASGNIVQHPEQQNGNINLYHNAFLVEVEIPAGGSPIDKRLMPMPNLGLFYGIPWTTSEGKAAAGRVPKKGEPFLPATSKNK